MVNTIDLKSVPATGYRFKSDSKQNIIKAKNYRMYGIFFKYKYKRK